MTSNKTVVIEIVSVIYVHLDIFELIGLLGYGLVYELLIYINKN